MFYFVENLFKGDPGNPDLDDEIVRHALVTHRGRIVHAGTIKAMEGS
jgi:hypothetical protein